MTRWHHGHSLVAGFAAATLVYGQHLLWMLTVVFAAGVLTGVLWRQLRAGLHVLAGRLRTAPVVAAGDVVKPS